MRTLVQSLGSVLVLLLVSSPVHAQNAQISGTLKDQTGGVLPGVTVTAKNIATGLTRSDLTDGGRRAPSWSSTSPGSPP